MSDRRPLYLLASQPMQVNYHHPALSVTMAECADAFYPLPRIDRVISRGAVDWHGDALTGCLAHQVPVLFVTLDGQLQGVLTPHRHPPDALSLHLASAMLAPEWPDRYDNWHRSQERRLIHHLATALNWNITDFRAQTVQHRLQLALTQRWQQPPQRLLGELMISLRATVVTSLTQSGLDADISAGLRGGINLADQLTRLTAWPLRGRLLTTAGRPPEQPTAAIRYYQQQLQRPLSATIDRLIQRLWQLPS